jgi:hypothetical protein
MFGELGLLGLTETGRRMRTAVSISECELLRMSKENFQTLILANSELRVAYRRLAQKFVYRLLEEAANPKSPIHDIDKHVHIYASWQKDKIPDDLRIQGRIQPPIIENSLDEEKTVTTTISLQLLLLSGFPMLHMAKGGVSVRFIISCDVGGLGKHSDVHTVQHEAIVTQGKPLELDFSTLLKYRHGLDKKQAIVNREDVTIKVVYLRWIEHAPGAELAVSLGHEQLEQDGAQMPRSGSSTSTSPRGSALPAPHMQTTIGVFTMKLKDLVSTDDAQPIVRADDAPELRVHGKGYRVTVLQGAWYTKTNWGKRELLAYQDPMELTIATKLSRELPTKSIIRSVFRRAWHRRRQKELEGKPGRRESPKPEAEKEGPKPEEEEEKEVKIDAAKDAPKAATKKEAPKPEEKKEKKEMVKIDDQTIREFLQPLFEPNVVEDYMQKLHDIGCDHVRDMMSMTAFDLRNLGIKKAEDCRIVLLRLAAAAAKDAPKSAREEIMKKTVHELKIGICNMLSKGDAGKSGAKAASFELQMERSTDDLIKRLRELKDQIHEVFIYNKNFELHMSEEMKHTLECLDRRIDSSVEMHVLALPVPESALKTWNRPMFVLNLNRVIQQNPKP